MKMNKSSAIEELNRRGASPPLTDSQSRFANVNSSKPVWWLDLPNKKLADRTSPNLDLILADSDGRLHHLRLPKSWLIANIARLAVRADKDVISLELSAQPHDRFTDVRPRSGRLAFRAFVMP
jgi:hypothetical protein